MIDVANSSNREIKRILEQCEVENSNERAVAHNRTIEALFNRP